MIKRPKHVKRAGHWCVTTIEKGDARSKKEYVQKVNWFLTEREAKDFHEMENRKTQSL